MSPADHDRSIGDRALDRPYGWLRRRSWWRRLERFLRWAFDVSSGAAWRR